MSLTFVPINMRFDASVDLELTRVVDVSPEMVWDAWIMPEHIVHWFTPTPWKTIEAQTDLRLGGSFRIVMQSPEGKNFPGIGCSRTLAEPPVGVDQRAGSRFSADLVGPELIRRI